MNEQEFVQYLKRTFPFTHGFGIGDDTSVVKVGDSYQLITKDILIEDVHFRLEDCTLRELALKSLAVNVSDISAMGGTPQYFYLGLGFPKNIPGENLTQFYQGMEDGCRKWNIQLAGGDYSSSEKMFISITLIGTASNPIYRSGAQTNDLIGITGVTGESAIGLKLLFKNIKNGYFIDKHKNVEPEVEKGKILSQYAHSMIDISDGVLLDLNRVLEASHKGAHLFYENIPVTPAMKEICRSNQWNEYECVLAGGEDYKLLFTISREKNLELLQANPAFEYYLIGEITDSPGTLIVEDKNKPIKLTSLGYDHLLFREKVGKKLLIGED